MSSENIIIHVTQEDQLILPEKIVPHSKSNENVIITIRFYGEDYTVIGKACNGGKIPIKEMDTKTQNFQNIEKSANPEPIGLMGFGLTTFLLNLKNIGVFEMNTMILGSCFSYFLLVIYFD